MKKLRFKYSVIFFLCFLSIKGFSQKPTDPGNDPLDTSINKLLITQSTSLNRYPYYNRERPGSSEIPPASFNGLAADMSYNPIMNWAKRGETSEEYLKPNRIY